MDQSCVTNWVLSKVHETVREFQYIEKEDLFAKFHTERTEISRDVFFAVLGRVMGQTPFANVIPYKKKGKAIGYKYLSYKTEENENSKFKSSQQKKYTKVHKKENQKQNVWSDCVVQGSVGPLTSNSTLSNDFKVLHDKDKMDYCGGYSEANEKEENVASGNVAHDFDLGSKKSEPKKIQIKK